MKGKTLFLLLFVSIFLPLLIFTAVPVYLKLLFTLNFSVIFIMTILYLYKDRRYSPILAAFIVFNFLFFILAPMLQIHDVYKLNDLKMPNKMIYKDYLMVKTNIFIFIFNIVFFVAYRFFVSRKSKLKPYKKDKYLPIHILILFGISVLILIANLDYIKTEYIEHNYLVLEGTSKSALLLKEKIILMVPFPAFILSVYYIKKCKKKNSNYYIVILLSLLFFVLLMAIKNPLTEKRNALGPIYLTIIFFLIPKLLNTNFKSLLFLFFAMVIIFPTISLITHSGYSLKQLRENPKLLLYQLRNHGVSNTFTTLNYDAFINFAATIEHAEKNDLSYGRQLSGGVFFFVPRKIWNDKPISTGEYIGEYLSSEYGEKGKRSFNNLSNPFVSEGYINFGIVGVILFAITLAYFLSIMVVWLNGLDPLKIAAAFYASMHMIFFLRGDFTNGYAFLVASFVVILAIPKIYFILFRTALKKRPQNAE
ncbi:O-antigen polysaccharide polymerase Wzy [uncultured Psychroserpens sp.]|uniref:O-antigen polysaccharide polymerase Wzy n=1 Tax=uncultured Psychroserpens sp. TaxID=255436 RepID=UPI0026121312|nr:O-antigen polysaccharide polymerase Wzy [uncultured Psychroserpens sp.]